MKSWDAGEVGGSGDDARVKIANGFSGEAFAVVQAGVVHGDVVLQSASSSLSPQTPVMAPVPPSGLVSRAGIERRLIGELQRGESNVVLCGAGGFGKTTLASWVCQQPDVQGRFPGGVLWIELGQRPSTERIVMSVAGLIAVLTGSAPRAYVDVSSAVASLRATLADRRTLLVVDDVWSATDLEPLLGAGEELTLLVTTRRTNVLDGTEISVDGVSEDEAVALLGQDYADTGTLMPLLRRSGHWPLALVLLAGILRSLVDRHAMSTAEAVSALVEELDRQGISVLDELSDTDVLRGISQTLELSLAELAATAGGPAARDRFVSLAAFPEGEVIPYWLLQRLWGLSEVRVRAEGDRFVSRSLAWAPHAGGLRLHDLAREAIRDLEPQSMATTSARLLDTLRPAVGWHRLPEGEHSFLHGLAFHLRQAGRVDELTGLLRDMRFLVARLAGAGPTALEADLELHATACPGDPHNRELAALVRQEGHLLTGRVSGDDLELILESRLVGRPSLLESLRHVEQARPPGGLVALHPLPDRDDDALLRSSPAHTGGRCKAIDWHARGDFLATVGYEPQIQIVTAHDWHQVSAVQIRGAVIDGVRWSPDGTWLAVIDDRDRFTPRPDWSAIKRRGRPASVYALAVYDPLSGTEIDVTPVPSGRFSDVPDFSWAPDSTTLAVISEERVSLWKPGSGAAPEPLPGTDQADLGRCDSIDWHSEHGLIAHATAGGSYRRETGTLLRWADPTSPQPPEIWRHPALWGASRGLEWRPDGRTVALKVPKVVLVVDPLARVILWRQDDGHNNNSTRWSPDGHCLAMRHSLRAPEALLAVWRIPPDQELSQGALPEPPEEIALGTDHSVTDSLAWHPDGSAIATTSDNRIIKLWRLDRPDSPADRPWANGLSHVMWSADGCTLAVRTTQGEWFSVDPQNPHADMQHCPAHPYTSRDPAKRDQWPEEVGVLGESESTSTPGILVEFAPDNRTYAVGRWFKPLQVVTPHGVATTERYSAEGQRRWSSICFTPKGDRIVTAAADNSWQKKIITVWPLGGANREHPSAQWMTDRHAGPGPTVEYIRRITTTETHAAVVANPGLIGLFRLSDMQNLCWINTNGTVRDAAFDPAGQRLAVVGDAGLYLFAVHDTPESKNSSMVAES